MSKLTINRIALGSLRRRRGQYKAMIVGAGLAIFFVSALLLSVQSIYESYRLMHVRGYGSQDAILRDAEQISPEALLGTGLVSEVGNVNIIGETEEGGCPIGFYDETGARMAGRQLIEGRLPERAGEIAVEQSFLQKLRVSAGVGDDIDIDLKVPVGKGNKFLKDAVKKTYRVVGLLVPQSQNLVGNILDEWVCLHYPSAIASGAEQVELGGRAIIHRMVTLRRGATFEQLSTFADDQFKLYNTINTGFNLFYNGGGMYSEDKAIGQIMVIIASVLGSVLILSACLGIVNAFIASLSQRRSQIGMMRAVGATSRQIRQLFGREAMLLAIIIAPLAIALSYLFVWGLTIWTNLVTFYANPWFLPINVIASLLCVALAAWIPLYSASKLPPMQAIRDVSLLRARKRAKVRAKMRYDVPRLIAARHLSLYKSRQIGIAFMVMLSILMISMAVPFVAGITSTPAEYGYEIRGNRWRQDSFVEYNVNSHQGLTDADIVEVQALPMVESVDAARQAQVNLLMDEVTEYAANIDQYNYWFGTDAEQAEYYNGFRNQRKLNQEVVPTMLFSGEDAIVELLSQYVLEGKIDIAELNAGRQVLFMAPEVYYRYKGTIPEAIGYIYYETSYKMPVNKTDVSTFRNDAFHVGDSLSILRLYTRAGMEMKEDGSLDFVSGINEQRASATIGAVLSGDAVYALNNMGLYANTGSMLTTNAGLAALGIETAGYVGLGASISGAPGDQTYAYLTDTFKGIAARGADMPLINNVQSSKDQALWGMVFRLALAAVILLLLSMCVSLVNSAITNRVRSDKRAIGTLRAVGAPIGDIVSSYRLQAFTMILWGVLLGIALSGIYYLWYYITQNRPYGDPLKMPLGTVSLAQVIFLAAVALMCWINLSLRVREIARDSIVTNIREL